MFFQCISEIFFDFFVTKAIFSCLACAEIFYYNSSDIIRMR